ncbi:hypothetical protein AGR8A_Cc70146 [Agrobacterium fabrum str. J-07]|nr:hypothetical protein AGR8A_Cc70146 [Agrobacterium fabrum str. J-07]
MSSPLLVRHPAIDMEEFDAESRSFGF